MAIAQKPLSASSLLSETTMKGEKNGNISRVREWRRSDFIYIIAVVFVHGLLLFAPSTFSWDVFWLAVFRYIISGLGITLCYHRVLAHRSLKLPKPLEYLFAYFALLSIQGDPIFWVSTHRYHHKVTDTEKDPHSPIQGFWFSHILWIFDKTYLEQKGRSYSNVSDLTRQRYYRFLKSTYLYHILFHMVVLYAFGGFRYIVWGMGVALACFYHSTFMVNSVCHMWGQRAWNTKDLSKNNALVAILTFGEGWHNNHHAFQASARQGLEWWQVDITWYVIMLLRVFGLATDIKVPSEKQMKMMAIKNGNEAAEFAYDFYGEEKVLH